MEFNAILIALFALIFPIAIGRPIVHFLMKKELPLPFISYFLAGLFTLFASTVVINLIGTFLNLPFPFVFQGIVSALAFILIPINIIVPTKDLNFKPYILPLLFSIGLGIGIFTLFGQNSPYPLNWDLYEHQTLIQNMISGRFSLIPSNITDTFGFNGYSTLFHTLLAAPQTFIKSAVLPLWNALDLIHLIIITFASYLFGKSVSGKESVGYLTAIFGGAVFDSTISFTNLFLMPQTFTAAIFIFLFAQLIESVKRNQHLSLGLIVINTLAIFLNHFIIGFVAGTLYLTTALFLKFRHFIEAKVNLKLVAEIVAVLAIIAILFSGFLPLESINKGEAGNFNFTLIEKFNALRQSYGFLPLFLLPIGAAYIVNSKKKLEVLIGVITVLLIALLLLQIPYVVKFFVLAKFFISFVLALGVFRLISNIKNRALYVLSYCLLLGALLILFATNATSWKGILLYNSLATQISPSEIEAASFLKNNYKGANALIISDPATQHVLEPLAEVNSQGGAYMDISTREHLIGISDSDEAQKVASTLAKIDDKLAPAASKKLFVLGGRYFEWQKMSEARKLDLSQNIWYPVDLSIADRKRINSLVAGSNNLKIVYENQALVVVEYSQTSLK